ncbi:MAG TPA: hypothetical protein DDW17_01050 [Deltaproteobacteria bacterium]|nr:hypothetical protein [Deltaproteobacteria bacterium]
MNASVYIIPLKTLAIKGNFYNNHSNNRIDKKITLQKNFDYSLINNNFNILYNSLLPLEYKNRLTENMVFAKVYNVIEFKRII